jgi:hypothetical protein
MEGNSFTRALQGSDGVLIYGAFIFYGAVALLIWCSLTMEREQVTRPDGTHERRTKAKTPAWAAKDGCLRALWVLVAFLIAVSWGGLLALAAAALVVFGVLFLLGAFLKMVFGDVESCCCFRCGGADGEDRKAGCASRAGTDRAGAGRAGAAATAGVTTRSADVDVEAGQGGIDMELRGQGQSSGGRSRCVAIADPPPVYMP